MKPKTPGAPSSCRKYTSIQVIRVVIKKNFEMSNKTKYHGRKINNNNSKNSDKNNNK